MECSQRVLVVALVTVGLVPTSLAAGHAAPRQDLRSYERAYQAVAHKFGHRAPGRNIAKWGLRHRQASDADILHSLSVLRRMLSPPPVPVASPMSTSTTTTPVSSGTTSSLPSCTWAPESGGNWHAVNPTSGAGGMYQILPSTWAANGGTGSPASASPAEQTQVAQNVMHSQGLGAWVNC